MGWKETCDPRDLSTRRSSAGGDGLRFLPFTLLTGPDDPTNPKERVRRSRAGVASLSSAAGPARDTRRLCVGRHVD